MHAVHLVGRTNSPARTLAVRELEKQSSLAATVIQKFILGKLGEILSADQSTTQSFHLFGRITLIQLTYSIYSV